MSRMDIPERLEQLEHVIVFPVNLSHCRDKLEENDIAYFPSKIWRSLSILH